MQTVTPDDAAELNLVALNATLQAHLTAPHNRAARDMLAATMRESVLLGANADMLAAWTDLNRSRVLAGAPTASTATPPPASATPTSAPTPAP